MDNPKPLEARTKMVTSAHIGKKILVVDDDTFMRWAISFRLRREGFVVLTASDGKEALKIARNPHEKPDLIVLDLLMPHVSGFEFLHQIREKHPMPFPIPIIIMSSMDHRKALEEGPKLEGFHFVEKPVELDELVHWINHFLAYGEN
jgi:DNA-binding response OmpR family regulator